MSKKIPDDFLKSIDWTVKPNKKIPLSKESKIIIEQLDKNPMPEKHKSDINKKK